MKVALTSSASLKERDRSFSFPRFGFLSATSSAYTTAILVVLAAIAIALLGFTTKRFLDSVSAGIFSGVDTDIVATTATTPGSTPSTAAAFTSAQSTGPVETGINESTLSRALPGSVTTGSAASYSVAPDGTIIIDNENDLVLPPPDLPGGGTLPGGDVGTVLDGTLGGVGDTVDGTLGGVGGLLDGTLSGTGTALDNTLSGLGLGGVGNLLDNTLSGTGDTLDNTLGGVGGLLDGTLSGTGTALDNTLSGLGGSLGGLLSGGGSGGGLLGGGRSR